MTALVHRVYIGVLAGIGILTFILLCYWGFSYYVTSLEQRPFHEGHIMLKPSGPIGHGLGILGTVLILVGVFSYILRKKKRFLPRFGALKYWLEFHIFLCSVGPLLILFHTAFKFGGIVSISFWSMVAVVLSGIIGRFIYIQIPRTIQGRELSLMEIKEMRDKMNQNLKTKYSLDESIYARLIEAINLKDENNTAGLMGIAVWGFNQRNERKKRINSILKQTDIKGKDMRGVMRLVKNEITLNERINRLQTMQKLFKYWHVAHLPFALIMMIIMVIHVGITIAFGYRWIF